MKLEGDIYDKQRGGFILEHHGVKGMKWGVRNPRTGLYSTPGGTQVPFRRSRRAFQQQRGVDRLRRVEAGRTTGANRATKTDKFIVSMFQIPTVDLLSEGIQGGSHVTLERRRIHKKKILSGKRKVADILGRAQGINIRDVNLKPLR